ncbi:hypothetical protein BDR03DRAFT_935365 [Suillus americanus]|nr:hypothetical protein BDR03DRAFT_935365 [Suillus americanus]
MPPSLNLKLSCQECIVHQHAETPFHRIKECLFGHDPGQHCQNPKSAHNDDFVVIDAPGIHEVGLDFCKCKTVASQDSCYLLCSQIFYLLSFESKVSAYESYLTLACVTDNTGIQPIRDRYSTVLNMVVMWHNIKMLIHAGQGNDPSSVKAIQQGQLVVLCPACLHPGKNLPNNWDNGPVAMRWLYSFFLAINANFRLKRHLVSTDAKDPGITHGWAYFVDECGHKSYLKENSAVTQELPSHRHQRSVCVSHDTVNLADTKSSKGLAATGVGAVDCTQYKYKLPNSIGDLQKGEKCYIPHIPQYGLSSLTHFLMLSAINFSYDVVCQWHKKLWTHVSSLPRHLQFSHVNKIIHFFVPKFHLTAHIPACQTAFSFKCGWANINRVASSTKEMGPRSHQDTLDDHFGDWNAMLYLMDHNMHGKTPRT